MAEHERENQHGLPVGLANLEFLPEGDTGGLDLSSLPPDRHADHGLAHHHRPA